MIEAERLHLGVAILLDWRPSDVLKGGEATGTAEEAGDHVGRDPQPRRLARGEGVDDATEAERGKRVDTARHENDADAKDAEKLKTIGLLWPESIDEADWQKRGRA